MAFSIVARLWGLVPKWLLVGASAVFIAYFMGVSNGRAPYKQAAKIFDARAEIIVNQTKTNKSNITQKGILAHEKLKTNICVLSIDDARILSDIKR